jgi:hypothetical protein
MPRITKNSIIITVLVLSIILFFFHELFWPVPKIYFTPELTGRGDIINFFYPVKYFLSETLKSGKLPFWNQYAGTGFPILAEGQVGTFNLTNLLLFSTLPTWLAFNLSILIIFSTNLLGSYLFFNNIGLSKHSSLFSAVVYTFGGYFVAHIAHFSLLQAMSYTPLILLISLKIWKKPDKKNCILIIFLISQQVTAGHPQSVLLAFMLISILFATQQIGENPNVSLKKFLLFIPIIILGIIIASAQLLPTAELYSQSIRSGTKKISKITQRNYSLNNLKSVAQPYYNGNLRDGSFNPLNMDQVGFPGETTLYIGIIPLILALIGIFRRDELKIMIFFLLIFTLSLILFLAKNSPFIFLYYLPIFNKFGEPARYLIFLHFSLSYFAGSGLDLMSGTLKKIRFRYMAPVIMIAFIGTVVSLKSFSDTYNAKIDVEKINAAARTTAYVPAQSRVIVDKSKYTLWNNYLLKHGWKNINSFDYFKNALDENINLLYKIGNYKFYTPLTTKRQNIAMLSINQNTVSTFSIDYIIAIRDMSDNIEFSPIGKVAPADNDLPNFYVYKNTTSVDRFRFVSNYLVMTLSEATGEFMKSDQFNPATQVVLENHLGRKFEKPKVANIDVLKNEHTQTRLSTRSDTDSLLVVSDSYYPGWVAKIDGKNTEIYPANINQRAIIVPAGMHIIDFVYRPWSFYVGATISFLTIVGIVIYIKYDKRILKYLKEKSKKNIAEGTRFGNSEFAKK